MVRYSNKILIVVCFSMTLLLTSCKREMGRIFIERPDTAFDFDDSASVDFRQGWDDGCEVGMSAGSNTFYKMFYRSNKIDGYKMVGSSDYKNAWNSAFWYCYRYDYIKHDGSIWGSPFGGYK